MTNYRKESNYAYAGSSLIRTSIKKANPVAGLIRGQKLEYARLQLEFCNKNG